MRDRKEDLRRVAGVCRRVGEMRHVNWPEVIKNPGSREIRVRNRTINVPGRVINLGVAVVAGSVTAGLALLAFSEITNVAAIHNVWTHFPQLIQHDVPAVVQGLSFRFGLQKVIQKRQRLQWMKDKNVPGARQLDEHIKRSAWEAEPLTAKERWKFRTYHAVPWMACMVGVTIGSVLLLTQAHGVDILHGVWNELPAAVRAHWVVTASTFGIRHGYGIATKPVRQDNLGRRLRADGWRPADYVPVVEAQKQAAPGQGQLAA